MNSLRFLASLSVSALLVVIAPTSNASNGSFALSGSDAAEYSVPLDMKPVRSFELSNYGITYERYQQYFGNARVLGGQVTLHKDETGEIVTVIGAYYPNIQPVNAVGIEKAKAHAIVDQDIGRDHNRLSELMVNPRSGRYFFRLESRRNNSRWIHWVDAGSGVVLNKFDALMTNCESLLAPCGTGAHYDVPDNIHGDVKNLADLTTPAGGSYLLQNTRVQTHDQGSTRRPFLGPVAQDSDNAWNKEGRESPGQGALVDAHFYVNLADYYFLDTHGYNLPDVRKGKSEDPPVPMEVHAHYTKNYVNAFWNGSYLAFGDGDGIDYDELTSLDVAVHEYTHAVTEYTSGLIYQNESGALNESFSDIMATSKELRFEEPGAGACTQIGEVLCPDWLIGEDFDHSGDEVPGFRNMADPEEDGLGIDHYSERYTGTSDNGGVHWNSAIPNHAYYLLAQNLGVSTLNASCADKANHSSAHCDDKDDTQDNNLAVVGIGLDDAEQIFFLGFASLQADATMCDARAATETVAGSPPFTAGQLTSTRNAWLAVGVTDKVCGSSNNVDNPPVATIVAPMAGSTVSGSLIVEVDASDDLDAPGTLSVTVSIAGTDHQASYNTGSGYYEYEWNTSGYENSSPDIEVSALDSSLNSSVVHSITVTVDAPSSKLIDVHVSDLDGSSTGKGAWTATVTVEVSKTIDGSAANGATVYGDWSDGTVASCVTGSGNQCSMTLEGIKSRQGSVSFTVGDITGSSYSYDSGSNHDPDGDSRGTVITILKP